MKPLFSTIENNAFIILVVIAAFLLRCKGLDFQSLWLDELHTMNEASPLQKWSELFRFLKCCDQHPPLYFITERLCFSVFGYTSYVARFVSVIAGTAGVWAMYLFGKEILNKSLGIICAMLTTVNFYHLTYSQEARPYIFAFLFAALSFVYFIKLVKGSTTKTAVIYAVLTLLLLYSHYYSLFVVAAQAVLALCFIFQEKKSARKALFKCFLVAGIIITVGYAPWLPFLHSMAGIKTFWIQDISPASLQNFFFEYFGNAELLNPLLLLLLFCFFARVSFDTENNRTQQLKDKPLQLSFIVILVWVFIVFLIPYLRSLLVVPMLYPRYTIVLVPAILLALAYSIKLFKNQLVQYSLVILFLSLSLIHLFFINGYYKTLRKTQFREMTAFVVKENMGNYPIINERTAWHQAYYLQLYGSKAKVLTDKKEDIIRNVLEKKSPQYDLKAFWIVGAHGDNFIDSNTLKILDTAYVLIKRKEFVDAWAQLYLRKRYADSSLIIIKYNDFKAGEGTVIANDKQIAIWGGSIHSNPVQLKKGTYKLMVTAKGTKAAGEYPHLKIYCNGVNIAGYFVSEKMDGKTIEFDNPGDGEVIITVELDNDFFIAGKEDRNVFLESILLSVEQ